MEKKILVAGLGHRAMVTEATFRQLQLMDVDVLNIEHAKEDIKHELTKRRPPLPQLTQLSHAIGKQKKDKSKLKRYSSYWNKKRP